MLSCFLQVELAPTLSFVLFPYSILTFIMAPKYIIAFLSLFISTTRLGTC